MILDILKAVLVFCVVWEVVLLQGTEQIVSFIFKKKK
jgi:hypothetical protein